MYKQTEKQLKLYKSRPNATDFSGVIDFDEAHQGEQDELGQVKPVPLKHERSRKMKGELSLSVGAKAYAVTGYEGFFFIRGALDTRDQLRLAGRCSDWTNSASHSNVQREDKDKDEWSREELKKLRWVTLGYHYDWSNRTYRQGWQSPFPPELSMLSVACAEAVGCNITPEAAILNYYHQDSCMGGHQDDLEFCMDAPVVSVSIGNTAVFLLGGFQKRTDPAPLAMFVRSGDVIVMGGGSRLRYHGVPRILADSYPEELRMKMDAGEAMDQEAEEAITAGITALQRMREVLGHPVRINVNVRQVLSKGQSFPKAPESVAASKEETLQLSACKKPKLTAEAPV